MVNIKKKKVVGENQNTHFMFDNFLRKSCHLRNNVEEYGTARRATDDITVRRMCNACWIIEATDTHNTLYCLQWQKMICEYASLLPLHVHWLSCL